MHRLGLAVAAIALCVLASACASPTGPARQGEWMLDGTWCSGYTNPQGECVEGD